ncbi:MAG: sensor histidine kinase [Burkholderiaceae bacterium]
MNVRTANLHRRLMWRLIPTLFGAIALGGVASYFVAKRSVDFAYDEALTAAAADIASGVHVDGANIRFDLSPQSEHILRSDARDDIYFSVHQEDGRYFGGDRDLPETGPVTEGGGASSDLPFRERIVRAMSVRFAQGATPFVVTVAETTRKRRTAAWAVFAQLMLPTTLVLSLACLIVWFSVKGGLQPLDELRTEIEARSELDLSPIAAVSAPQEVRSLVQALNHLLARLDAATRAHQAFVADAAHQLRTPLAGIHTQIELLATTVDPSQAPTLERLRFSVDRAVRLVNQLLALARSEKDADTLRLKTFDLAELVAEAADSWVHRAIAAGIDFGFDLKGGKLLGDRYLIREMLENLIDNAIRHTPSKGHITVAVETKGSHVEIALDDSGPGIVPALRERIFDRFYRAEVTGTGSGLGLAIVRQIITRHEGTVTARNSASLGGLQMVVRLPVHGPAALQADTPPPNETAASRIETTASWRRTESC